MTELLKCEVCSSTTDRDRIFGTCGTCSRPVCSQCQRICDGCTRIFCMNDVWVKDEWIGGMARRMKLCERCK